MENCSYPLNPLLYFVNDETAPVLYKKQNLRHLGRNATADTPKSAGLLSAEVIKRLSTHTHAHIRGKGAMLETIVKLIPCGEERVRFWVTSALLEQVLKGKGLSVSKMRSSSHVRQ